MQDEDKKIVLKMQELIDIILEDQNRYYIDSKMMIKLNDYIHEYDDVFDEEFVWEYLNFLENINNFFEYLIEKLEYHELNLIDKKEIDLEGYLIFNFNDFYAKKNYKEFLSVILSIQNLFKNNITLQGIVFFLHLNNLLKQYMFLDNKIKIVDKVPTIEIDYSSRLHYYKEQYVTIFRQELEEGIRTGVFIEDEEIITYILNEIKELKNELHI